MNRLVRSISVDMVIVLLVTTALTLIMAAAAVGSTKIVLTKAENSAMQVAARADGLLKFKSCGKDCATADDKYDFILVNVRDGLLMMELSPINTIDSTGNLTGASYMEIAVQKAVVEHYLGSAGWNWLISPHGVFYQWGMSKSMFYTTWTNIDHHHFAFAADNETATYTLTITL